MCVIYFTRNIKNYEDEIQMRAEYKNCFENYKLDEVKGVFTSAIKTRAYHAKVTQKEFARQHGFCERRLSEVFRQKYDKITLDRLCIYLAKVDPSFLFHLSLTPIVPDLTPAYKKRQNES